VSIYERLARMPFGSCAEIELIAELVDGT